MIPNDKVSVANPLWIPSVVYIETHLIVASRIYNIVCTMEHRSFQRGSGSGSSRVRCQPATLALMQRAAMHPTGSSSSNSVWLMLVVLAAASETLLRDQGEGR